MVRPEGYLVRVTDRVHPRAKLLCSLLGLVVALVWAAEELDKVLRWSQALKGPTP